MTTPNDTNKPEPSPRIANEPCPRCGATVSDLYVHQCDDGPRTIAAKPQPLPPMELLQLAQCGCSPKERDSGHLTDCWCHAFESAVETLRRERDEAVERATSWMSEASRIAGQREELTTTVERLTKERDVLLMFQSEYAKCKALFAETENTLRDCIQDERHANARMRAALEPLAKWIEDYELMGGETLANTEWVAEQSRAAKAAIADAGPDPVAELRAEVLTWKQAHLTACKDYADLRAECERLRGTLEAVRMVGVKWDGSCSSSNLVADIDRTIASWHGRACKAEDECERLRKLETLVKEGRHAWNNLNKHGVCILDFMNCWLDQERAENGNLKADILSKDHTIENLRKDLKTHQELVTAQNQNLITDGHTIRELRKENAELKERISEHDEEIGDFQNQVRSLVIDLSKAPDHAIDGKGSDAGWQEFTLAEISQGFAHLSDNVIDPLREQVRVLREAAHATAELCPELKHHGGIGDEDYYWSSEHRCLVIKIGNMMRNALATTVPLSPDANPASPERKDVAGLVHADIEARVTKGAAQYGERLKLFNGRDSIQDAYEEVLDLALYLKQHIAEQSGQETEGKV